MEAASNISRGFTDDDDDDEGYGRRDGSSRKELTVKVDGKSNNDQKPSTPRSKHSATEQRRRSKINDRFQILRDLIPHTDQKRDKASFLLEVIEYVQFLQEKVQKYESEYTGWNQDTTNVLPWVKVFFRSFWENSRQKIPQVPVEGTVDPSNVVKNGAAPTGYVSSGDNVIPGAPVMLTNNQASLESENANSRLPSKATPEPVPVQQYGATSCSAQQQQQRLISGPENMAYPSQSQCMKQDTMTGSRIDDEQELTIDEGTINISSAYSQGLLHALTQCLQNSGIDLSQASINVQISLGKRALNRPIAVPNEHEGLSSGNHVAGHSRSGSSGEESDGANKRHKMGKS